VMLNRLSPTDVNCAKNEVLYYVLFLASLVVGQEV
jgi:hypothetical protein